MDINTALRPEHIIYVAGHNGMVGSAILRNLKKKGFKNFVTRTQAELDLVDQNAVMKFFQTEKIDYIVLAAAKVGGINANNTYPAQFIYENLMIQSNVIHNAYAAGIKRLLFLGSSCIYPKLAPQPMKEEYLLNGDLEPTNEAYAVAKIAGIKICESFNRQYGTKYRSVMPTNLYGQGDYFHEENSHVVPALIRKSHEAKIAKKTEITIWGTGKSLREFMHVDDMADASVHIMSLSDEKYEAVTEPMNSHINLGTGQEMSIRNLTETICAAVGFDGNLIFNASMPEGVPRKLLDTGRLQNSGWKPQIPFQKGITDTYKWFLDNLDTVRV